MSRIDIINREKINRIRTHAKKLITKTLKITRSSKKCWYTWEIWSLLLLNLNLINYARDISIVILCFLPHTTHCLPLNI